MPKIEYNVKIPRKRRDEKYLPDFIDWLESDAKTACVGFDTNNEASKCRQSIQRYIRVHGLPVTQYLRANEVYWEKNTEVEQ